MRQKPVPIDLFAKLKYPYGLAAGPDGRLCFGVKTIDLAANRSRSALWLLDGDTPTQLTGPAELRGHWWAGPGRLLLAKGGGKKEKAWQADGLPFTLLETLDLADPAAKPRRLARLFLEVEDAAVLHGGEIILLARWDPAAEAALERAKGDPEKAAALLREDAPYKVLDELPFWENGGGFVGGKRRRLYLLKDGKAAPLTDEDTGVERFCLSPSGESLWAIARRYRGKMPLECQLFHIEPAGRAVREVTFGKLYLERVVPLSDRTALVAGTDMRLHGESQNPAFYRLELDDAYAPKAKKLYSGGRYSAGNNVNSDAAQAARPRWLAEGNTVYWVTTIGGDAQLMKIDAESGKIEPVTKAAGAVHELARLPGGQMVISALRGQKPPELYRVETDGAERQLTDFGAPVCEGYAFAVPKPMTVQSPGGRKVHGYVLSPPDLSSQAKKGGAAEAGSRPAILSIHGGPKTAWGTVLHHEMQWLAAQGYTVIFCNPIGSDGRGDVFGDLRNAYGGPDYDDLMAFLDAALAAYPEIDPARLGVMGGSYGGFMTNWIIGRTDRFKAAISQRGIANWVSMAVTSDIGYYFVPSDQGVTIWQDVGALWAHSPLRLADKAKTPTLFIHSDEDFRCPAGEGIQMYAALKEHGVPARMCLFHGENHDLSRSGKPKARLRRLQEILAWFEQYLK
ncbi:S9 family peptidase [Ruminococcaceae bacterium OttesenSCG-928-D13]|nr:S9 family peptidase [Ruminococcaceae bacterium OttesenSCG-928-D13]